jgi:DMATS type aromatic prenyltransferase
MATASPLDTAFSVSSAPTMVSAATDRLERIARAAGLAHRASEMRSVVSFLLDPWGTRAIGDMRGWTSDVADDGSPFEVSTVIGAPEPEVRLLVEAQAFAPDLASQWDAGRALTDRLAERHGVSLDRLRAVESLFRPSSGGRFAMWHAVVFKGDSAPSFKIYLDAQAQGRWRAPRVLEEALHRLGFKRAWSSLSEGPLSRGPYDDEPKYFSLDLDPSDHARVKLYFRHHRAGLDDVRLALGGTGSVADAGAAFVRALAGDQHRYEARPLFSCHAFIDGDSRDPAARAIYVPVEAYAANDAEIVGRVSAYLRSRGVDPTPYELAIDASARRPLSAKKGLHSYVGLREEARGPRLTVYLSPEVDHVSRPAPTAVPAPEDRHPREIVRRFENDQILADHPFLARLARDPVDMSKLWLVMANFWEGVVHDFPKRLSHMVAKVDDDHVRCILTKQLHDELGEGDFSRAHKAMFQRMVRSLEPYRVHGDDAVLLAPGRGFSKALGVHVYATDPWESVGALMMIEVYGKEVDTLMGAQFRRQSEVGGDDTMWLRLHEALEVDHAGDSLELAELVPDDPQIVAAVWRGAEGVVAASRAYFDALYRVAFS